MFFQASITKYVDFMSSEGSKMVKSEKKYINIETVSRCMSCASAISGKLIFPGRKSIRHFGKNANAKRNSTKTITNINPAYEAKPFSASFK